MSGTRRGHVDLGLFLLRFGIGILFFLHGLPKLFQRSFPWGHAHHWADIGSQGLGILGILRGHVFWGLAAAISETVGGALLVLGLFIRPASLLVLVTLLVAMVAGLKRGQGFSEITHPLALAVVFLTLLVSGGGDYSLSQAIPSLQNKWYR